MPPLRRVAKLKNALQSLGYPFWANGDGKNSVSRAFGNQAAWDGRPVRYHRLLGLLGVLPLPAQLSTVKQLILHDWLMVELTADQRRDLMEAIGDRHQRDPRAVQRSLAGCGESKMQHVLGELVCEANRGFA